eukprot:TRINITY_DN1512_c0_g1_i3.p2 TRINITY_DN1512_c0_g1~~TRINITY_DN1512_c0_g1_i3.p2  ORF type:complete len:147 (-),score=40.06 TRINITY_DN1512_c0_g1_i3:141-581(-)
MAEIMQVRNPEEEVKSAEDVKQANSIREVTELRTIENPLTKALKEKNSVQSTIQAALEFNRHTLLSLENSKASLSKEHTEQTLIALWSNLKELAKSADKAAVEGRVKDDVEVVEANEECEEKKKGQGVQSNLIDMTITIDKESLLY